VEGARGTKTTAGAEPGSKGAEPSRAGGSVEAVGTKGREDRRLRR
jgi:hypothetical protein